MKRLHFRKTALHTVAATGLLLGTLGVQAQEFYVSGSLGQNFPDDIDTDGVFSSAFTTGTVTGVNPPLTLSAGTPVNWDTKIDNGMFFSFALGWNTDLLRYEIEYSGTNNDIDSHRGVTAGGLDLSGIDAGVLISGNTGDLGVSVADLVADGRGEIETSTFMLSAIYDIELNGAFTPFVGLGLGQTNVDVVYRPGGVDVINDDANAFVWQVMAGVGYALNDRATVQASWRYRDGEDADVNASLLPARFAIGPNQSHALDIGFRYAF